MTTQERYQAAVDEIRAVCRKYGIVLFGTCESEGIHGEITIQEDTSSSESGGWMGVEASIRNVVEESCTGNQIPPWYWVDGIGDLQSQPKSDVGSDA